MSASGRCSPIDHIPPKGQHTVRYYGIYSNKSRGITPRSSAHILRPIKTKPPSRPPTATQILLIPPPPKRRARDMRPLWRDLILKVWGGDPLQCPCCKGTMKPVRTFIRREEIEFFLRLHGLWEGIVCLPCPSPPPFDIDTMEPIEPPWQAIKEWIPDDEPDPNWFNQERKPVGDDSRQYDQSPTWRPIRSGDRPLAIATSLTKASLSPSSKPRRPTPSSPTSTSTPYGKDAAIIGQVITDYPASSS